MFYSHNNAYEPFFCKSLIYELHRKTTFFYICSGLLHSFEIWHCYIKRLCEWEERLKKSEQSLPLSVWYLQKNFFNDMVSNIVSFLYKHFYPTFFIQIFNFAKKLITRIKSVCQFTNRMPFHSECYDLCFMCNASMKSKDAE